MLQQFIRFPEFAEFSEFLIHLGKHPLNPFCIWVKWAQVPVDIVFILLFESFPWFYSFFHFRTARNEMIFLPVSGEFQFYKHWRMQGGSPGVRPSNGPNFS